MKKFLIIFLANLIFITHAFVVFVLLFGWAFKKFEMLYPLVLVLTLITEGFWGYCILTKIEFNLRKKIEPDLSYDYSFLSYYAYKIFHFTISKKIINMISITFLIASLVIYYYYTFLL